MLRCNLLSNATVGWFDPVMTDNSWRKQWYVISDDPCQENKDLEEDLMQLKISFGESSGLRSLRLSTSIFLSLLDDFLYTFFISTCSVTKIDEHFGPGWGTSDVF